jgi:ubiquinone/menaquinone biosynthesis C-methylase UbiE/DNA-binding transcriptional ArsR family regulator
MTTLTALSNAADAPLDTALSDLAGLLKACGDPLRLEILRLLERDAFGVLELCSLFDVKQSAMSHHLKVMSAVGLVEAQREGNSIFYRRPLVSSTASDNPLSTLYGLVDRLEIPASRLAGLTDIRHQRAQQSLAFFARHADDFQHHQERVADFSLYGTQVEKLLRQIRQPSWQHAIEIGPGEGRFLPVLASLFEQVHALDTSAEMLEKTRQLVQQKGLNNVTLVNGDTGKGLQQRLRADLIVMNMVLHHVPSPQEVLRDCGQLLKVGGSLVVCDLGHHDQQWTREACGDLWLGFAPEELTRWAALAGLDEGECLYLGVRNGFQVHIRQFVKPASVRAGQDSSLAPEKAPILVHTPGNP